MHNPVKKFMKHRGGPFTHKDKDGRGFAKQKIQKEIDELDDKWIKEEIDEFEKDSGGDV